MNRNATAHLARLEPTKNCTYSQFSLYAVAGTEMIVTALISVARKDRHAAHHGTLRRAGGEGRRARPGGGAPRGGPPSRCRDTRQIVRRTRCAILVAVGALGLRRVGVLPAELLDE